MMSEIKVGTKFKYGNVQYTVKAIDGNFLTSNIGKPNQWHVGFVKYLIEYERIKKVGKATKGL